MNAENFEGLEVSVQPQDKDRIPGVAALSSCRIWWRTRSFSDSLRCLHAVGSQTRLNGCGLGKAGISTALDTICLLYGLSWDNNSWCITPTPFYVLLDQLVFNKFYFTRDFVLCSFVSCPSLLSLPNVFSFSGC